MMREGMATETMGLLSNSKGKRMARVVVALQALGLVLALALTMHCALAAWDFQYLSQAPSIMLETHGGSLSSGASNDAVFEALGSDGNNGNNGNNGGNGNDASAHSQTKTSLVVTTESMNEPVSLAYDTYSTSCQHLGGENIEYLDRQDPHCPTHQAMKSFRFERCHGNDFKVVFKCGLHSNDIGSSSTYHETQCQDAIWNKMEFLDRHNVQCPAGEVLSRFHLVSSGCGWRKMKFSYWCRHADLAHWTDRDSSCEQLRGEHAEWLDRQKPMCQDNEVMTGWQLHSTGCSGRDMRFRVRCAKVLMPWEHWGQSRLQQYDEEYHKFYSEYDKERNKFRRLDYPNSPTGDRLKRAYEYNYRMYTHWKDKFDGIAFKRQAIRYQRQYETFIRDPQTRGKAMENKALWEKFEHLFQEKQGTLPQKVEEVYPTTLPKVANYSDPNYWNAMWTNKIEEERMKKVKPVVVDQSGTKAKCAEGAKCGENAHSLFNKASESLGDLLPHDPTWNKFPKALVEDRNTDQAKFKRAMATSTFDPLNNADFGENLSSERRAEADHVMFSHTGCSMGDEDCLRGAGVWPGSGTGMHGAGVNDEASAVSLMKRADLRLLGTLPEDPDWSEYPKSLVEDRQTRQAKVRDGLATKTYDPLENSDIGMVAGGHLRSRNQYRTDMREATGCDMGDVDCFDKFRKAKYASFPDPESPDCFGEHGCPKAKDTAVVGSA